MDKWADAYDSKRARASKVPYAGGGSGTGQKNVMDGTVDFAGSDGPLSDAQLAIARAKDNNILHLPVVAGAVVIMLQRPGDLTNLKLRWLCTIANIYLGKITKWNDPAIASCRNRTGVTVPLIPISRTVHRSDGSGTLTFIFTDYLSNVSADWKKNVGKATTVEWPGTGVGQTGSAGVAGQVQKTVGEIIGYIELFTPLTTRSPMRTLRIANGKFRYGVTGQRCRCLGHRFTHSGRLPFLVRQCAWRHVLSDFWPPPGSWFPRHSQGCSQGVRNWSNS